MAVPSLLTPPGPTVYVSSPITTNTIDVATTGTATLLTDNIHAYSFALAGNTITVTQTAGQCQYNSAATSWVACPTTIANPSATVCAAATIATCGAPTGATAFTYANGVCNYALVAPTWVACPTSVAPSTVNCMMASGCTTTGVTPTPTQFQFAPVTCSFTLSNSTAMGSMNLALGAFAVVAALSAMLV
jgi:hypothetical protein